MTINKFQGKTESEAIEKAKAEFGENAVIMNVKEVKPKGIFRAFKNSTYEVTAAMEEKEQFISQFREAAQELNKVHETVNLAADEKIDIPKPVKPAKQEQKRIVPPSKLDEEKKLEERLDDLSKRLEETLGHASKEMETVKEPSSEELNFVRILYSTLVKNEVNEQYVNQILDEIEKFIRPGNSVDIILSNVYQKLILRFGQPKMIDLSLKLNFYNLLDEVIMDTDRMVDTLWR